MSCYLNVYVLLARILDEEGKSFLPLWINGCVTSLESKQTQYAYKIEINETQSTVLQWTFLVDIPCSL